MRTDFYTKAMLTLIAVFLGILAFRPMMQPPATQAQTTTRALLHFDEKMSRIQVPDGSANLTGRVAIDLRTGNVYGFPTDVAGYPRDVQNNRPAVSDPILLGRFNLDRIRPQPYPSGQD